MRKNLKNFVTPPLSNLQPPLNFAEFGAPAQHTADSAESRRHSIKKQEECHRQGRIYYEANEASASGPHHLGGPHQNFNAVSKVDILLRKKSLKVNLLKSLGVQILKSGPFHVAKILIVDLLN